MYRLDNNFARGRFTVTVVGCGGTGGFVAEGLCRILPAQASLVLVDHDRVEERNLGRQNFYREDIGRFKSEALAQRLAGRFQRTVAYSLYPVRQLGFRPSLVIGCVDNGPARSDIAWLVQQQRIWWIDAGNGDNFGQVLIGSRVIEGLRSSFDSEQCHALPLPTVQRPDILAQVPRGRSCAEAVQAGEQSATINQIMAALVLEAVRRLIEGTCPWMQLYVDMEAGTLMPVLATPENVSAITGIEKRHLMIKPKEVKA